MRMIEMGDLAPGTGYSIPKDVVFITDRYGYRYAHPSSEKYHIVIVGDSMVAGPSLTQEVILSEVLSARLQQRVYPLAPSGMWAFASDERFTAHSPDIVILESLERDIEPGLCNPWPPPSQARYLLPQGKDFPRFLQDAMVFFDRFFRNPTYLSEYIRGRINKRSVIANAAGMVFYEKSINMRAVSDINTIVNELKVCKTWMESRGIRFIFLPVPDKENLYFDTIPNGAKPANLSGRRQEFLQTLIEQLDQSGIAVVPTLAAFQEARSKNIAIYHQDDTYWNPTGVQITADLLTKMILDK